MDVMTARRRFGRFHDELRNMGMNPVEAVETLASLVVAPSHNREKLLAELSPRARQEAHALLAENVLSGSEGAIAFQELLVAQARNGLGQYLTPLPVARLVGEVIGSALDSRSLVIDPFCGSGILLEETGRVSDARLLGVEINASVATIAEAFASLSAKPFDLRRGDALQEWLIRSLPIADACVTNPPFGALATGASHAKLADAGMPQPLLRMDAIPAELVGLELAVQLVREGGMVGIVLPQSVVTNTGWREYRASIFSRLELSAIVTLPEETFAPFRGVAKSCILFGKRTETSLPTGVSFHRSVRIGYDGTGREIGASDLLEIGEAILAGASRWQALIESNGSVALPQTTPLNGVHRRVRLADVAELFRGKNPARQAFNDEGTAPWLLKVGDLSASFIEWRERPKCHVSHSFFLKNPTLHLRVGDICLTASAHRPSYIGLKVDFVDALPPSGAMPSGEVLAVRVKDQSPIRPEALLFYFRSAEGYQQIQDLVRGSTGHLYPKDLMNMEVPVPDVSAQDVLSKMFWDAAADFRAYLELERVAAAEAALIYGNALTVEAGLAKPQATPVVQDQLNGIA